MIDLPWPQIPALEEGQVHLYWGRMGSALDRGANNLSESELKRAGLFRFERDRQAFLARRTLLRQLLGRHSGLDSAAISIEISDQGKPFQVSEPSLSFNLSHSADRFLIALARGRELGVDLQQHALKESALGVARGVFTQGELSELTALPDAEHERLFFRGWTRKEAALKCLGTGFLQEARELHVGLEEAALDAQPWNAEGEPKLEGHRLLDLPAPSGFSAALCCSGSDWSPQHFHQPT